MITNRRERIIVGFMAGFGLAFGGAWVRASAHALAGVSQGPGATFYPEESVRANAEIGLALMILGLVLVAISFHHWLSPNSMSPEQS